METEIEYDKRFFNKPFWILQKAKKRFVVLYGGSNSSKSWSNYQHLLLWLLEGDENAIVFRKHGSTLRNSVYENLKLCAKQLEIFHYFDFLYSNDKREVVCKFGENRIVMSGLDEPDKLKSIAGIKRVILEEADAFTEDDWKELVRRFRGVEGIQFVLIFNPVSEQHWIKKVLFDTPAYSSRAEHHCFTIDDNRFATADDYAELEALKDIDQQQYRIYRYGEWGVIKAGNPYLLHLSRKVNGGVVAPNKREGFIFVFDFNVRNSVTIWQKWRDMEGYQIQCLEEIHIGGNVDSDLEAICRRLADKYGRHEIHFTGDASGNNRSALTEGNAEAFELVRKYLARHGCKHLKYVKLRGNPRRKKSRFVTNAITKELGERFRIDESCKELWADIDRVPINLDGDLDKAYCDKNDVGHLLDTLRYFVWVFTFDIWRELRKRISVPKEYMDDSDDNNTIYDFKRAA